jgi:hypothetical protein
VTAGSVWTLPPSAGHVEDRVVAEQPVGVGVTAPAGRNGTNGTNGTSGTNGTNGATGRNGRNGSATEGATALHVGAPASTAPASLPRRVDPAPAPARVEPAGEGPGRGGSGGPPKPPARSPVPPVPPVPPVAPVPPVPPVAPVPPVPPVSAVPGLPDLGDAESDASGLFEALTPPPMLPDPSAPRPPDPLAVSDEDADATPIYAEVSTGWFRAAGPRAAEPVPEPVPEPVVEPDPATEALTIVVPAAKPAAPPPPDSDFATAADSGWQAVQEARTHAPSEDLTLAGLPKRVPRARLLPGSATQAGPEQNGAPGRDATAIRGRLASFQRGVQRGRENLAHPGDDGGRAQSG